jgi:protease I
MLPKELQVSGTVRLEDHPLAIGTPGMRVSARDYAILVLGGRAPEYLRNDRRLLELVREFDAQQKWIFALCHGIQVLAAAGLTNKKCVTCYEHIRFEAEQAGGTFLAQQAVRDGRIVTGQTWQSHPEFYREIFACLAPPLFHTARS